MKNIVLIGFMGTGKTTAAKLLAKERKMKYVSTDVLVEKKEGRKISRIFEESGEPYFRKIEKEIVKDVSLEGNTVIDAGGGVVLDEANIDNLKRNGIIICLWAEPKEIHKRTKKHKHRPLLKTGDPMAKIKNLLDARRPFYEKADYHIDTTSLNACEVVKQIQKRME